MSRSRAGRHARLYSMLVATAAVTTACGVDQGVISISAAPTPEDPAAPSAGSNSAPDGTTAPSEAPTTGDESVSTTTVVPESTLPPIIEPELFTVIPFGDVVDVDENRQPGEHDDLVAVAFTDIEAWWEQVFPEVYGEPFVPLSGGLYAGYPERESEIPGCGEPSTSYVDLQAFVAFYCELDDFMAYDDGRDDDSLLLPLADEYGSALMGVVLAHEYGHVIQARIGALEQLLPTIITEQQADCFAGAWTGHAYRGESDLLRLGDRDVRAGLLAMLSVRDPIGTDQFVPGGHGSAFDRVGAFQEGFVSGPARCAELLDAPLDLMPNRFLGAEDLRRGGNAPYVCQTADGPDCRPAPEFLADDLNHFWQVALGDSFEPVTVVASSSLDEAACSDARQLGGDVLLCPADRTLIYDEPEVVELYDEFGDFTLGYFYGIGWADLVQDELESALDGEERALLNDCFTGAWVRDITPDQFGSTPRSGDRDGDGIDDSIASSPGDLDEAIQMAILVGDPGANVNVVGSPFEKIAAFRAGVLGGLDACSDLLP